MEDIIEVKEENIDFGKYFDVIKDAFYKPNYDKVKNRIEEIFNTNSSIIFGYFKDDELLGSIVVRILCNKTVIDYIGVREDFRKNNIGFSLIKYVMNKYQLPCSAETDSSSVVFYEKCGFVSKEIIKEYNGEKVVRFNCFKSLH